MNQASVEFQVNLGLQNAQSQVDKLRKMLEDSVKGGSTAFTSINSALDGVLRQVSKIKSEMGTAFKTSQGSSRLLKQYDQLFNTINSIADRFNYLKEADLILPEETTSQIKNIRSEISGLQQDIKRIESGKIEKIFNNEDIEAFKKVRELAAELNVDLSKITFDTFTSKIAGKMTETKKEIDEVTESINKLQKAASAKVLDKDSIINSLSKGDLADVTSQRISNTASATKLKQEIVDAYKDLGAETVLGKDALSNVKAGSDVADIFIKQEAAIKSAADNFKAILDTKKAEMQAAYDDLMQVAAGKKSQSAGEVLNWEGKLDLIDKISAQFKNLNLPIPLISTQKNGRGINGYVKEVAAALLEEINSLNVEELQNALIAKLQQVFENANTKTTITDVSGFKSQLNQALADLKIDFDISQIEIKKGSSIDSIINDINTAIMKSSANTDTSDLEQRLQKLTEKLREYKEVQDTVFNTQSSGDAELAQKKQRIDELTESLANLLGVSTQDIRSKLSGIFQGTDNEVNNARSAIDQYANSLNSLERKQKALSNVEMAVTRWMGFYQVLNLTKRAVNDMKKHIQELDTVMTKIAVVTNMSTKDLWGQISKYSEIARQYGVAIKGVYEVSQIYYQQGLNKGDVMGLTTETLKMARIAGIDYATAADYMTTAIRGFKLEMSDAAHVTDVFSNLAAHTASSTEELATAISKTAASAASVGASFESTSAMMATMIATTRESATNIGTALKSIISRYGEMKAKPEGTDSEGEEYSLNKVDKALQTIGISIHDVNGEFRNFDDVILELAEAWDGVDKNTQRYIATVMAGNRQQSRFLALVSNVEEYKRALELANDAEGSGELQTLKTLDSIDAKIERMKVTIQEFYTTSGIQDLYKNILDTITNIISAANSLPKIFDTIPAQAIAIGANIIRIAKSILVLLINSVRSSLKAFTGEASTSMKSIVQAIANHLPMIKNQLKSTVSEGIDEGGKQGGAKLQTTLTSVFSTLGTYVGSILSAFGGYLTLAGMNDYGKSTTPGEDIAAGQKTVGGAVAGIFGDVISGAAMGAMTGAAAGSVTGPGAIVTGAIGAILGGIKGLVTNLATLQSGLEMQNVTTERRIELAKKEYDTEKTKRDTSMGKQKELTTAVEKLKQLEEQSYTSAAAMEEYHQYMNQLAESYPNLVTSIDSLANSTIEVTSLEQALASARLATAEATLSTAKAELKVREEEKKGLTEFQNNLNKMTSSDVEVDEMYRFITNTKTMTGNDRIHSELDLAKAFNEWAAKQGDVEQLNLEMPSTYRGTLNDWAHARLSQVDPSVIYRWYDELMRDLSIRKEKGGEDYEVVEASEGVLEGTRQRMAQEYINYLQTLQDSVQEADDEINLQWLTGNKDFDSLDDIKTWSYHELSDSIKIAKQRIQKYIDNADEVIQTVGDTIQSAEIDEAVENNLSAFGADKQNAEATFTASKYASLMKFMIGGRYKESADWNNETNQSYISELRNWVVENETAAAELMNLDYTKFRDFSDIKFNEAVFTMQNAKGESIWDWYVTVFEEEFIRQRDAITKGLKDQLDKSPELKTSSLYNLFDKDIENGELNTDLLNNLRGQLKEYASLKEKGYDQEAKNYLSNLEKVYGQLSQYGSEQQEEISSIITSVDWSDSASLSAAAESLRKLGPDYEDLAQQFEVASQRLITNLATSVTELYDSAKTTMESIEKVAGQVGKATKGSDALENMKTMLQSYTEEDKDELTFEDLYSWDNQLKGYVLTAKGIEVWLNSVNSENAEKLADAEQALTEAKAMYGEGDQTGLFSSENGIDIRALNNYLYSLYSDPETGRLKEGVTVSDIFAKRDRYLSEYQNLQKEFEQKRISNQELTWEEFIEDKRKTLVEMSEWEIEALKSMPQQTLLGQITSLDFGAIAGGKGNASKVGLQEMLKEALGDSYLGDNWFETKLWPQLLAGKFDALNAALEGTGVQVSAETQTAAAESAIKQYTDGLSEILDKPQSKWSEETKNLLKELGKMDENDYLVNGETPAALAKDLMTNLKAYLYEGTLTVEQYNQEVIKLAQESGFGKEKLGLDLITSGFDINAFEQYLRSMNLPGTLEEYFNFSTKEFTKTLNGVNLNDLFDYDVLTNTFKIDVSRDMNQVVQEVMTAFKLTEAEATAKVKEIIRNQADEAIKTEISNAQAEDVGYSSSEQVGKLAGAKIGDYIQIDKISKPIKDKLEGTLGKTLGNYIQIQSTDDLDNILSGLEAALEVGGLEVEEEEQIRTILSSLRSKTSQYEGIKGIIGKSVSESAASAYATAMGYGSNVREAMEDLNFEFIEDIKQWKQTEDTIQAIRDKIAELGEDASITDKNTLQALLLQLESEDASNINSSISSIAQNYKNISIDTITTLANAQNKSFDSVVSALRLQANGNGTYNLQPSDLINLLNVKGLTEETRKSINSVIASIADNYSNNITKATDLALKGTTSQADIESFRQAYKDTMGRELVGGFSYNDILNAWTLDPAIIQEFVRKQAEELVEAGVLAQDKMESYIKDQTVEIAQQSIDFSSFFKAGGANKTVSDKTREMLKGYYATTLDNLASTETSAWYQTAISNVGLNEKTDDEIKRLVEAARKRNEDAINAATDASMQRLKQGGKVAVDEMINVKGLDNLSTEEISSAYRYLVDPLVTLGEKIDSLEKGSIVDKDVAKLLNSIDGFTVLESGVVQSVGNLQDAYKAVFEAMIATGNATTEDLNNLAKAQLNNKFKRAKTTADTLSKSSLTVDDLINMYTAAGETFGQEYEYTAMTKNGLQKFKGINTNAELERLKQNGLIDYDELGNITVTDFEKFAQERKLKTGTEAYRRAYSSWIDSTIAAEGETTEGRGLSQLQKFLSAGIGEKVNITDIDDSIKDVLQISGNTYEVLSEFQKEQLILAADEAKITDEKVLAEIKQAKGQIQSKRAAGNALKGIIAKSISSDIAETYLTSIGEDLSGKTTEQIQQLMADRGYIWNEYTNSYLATTDALTEINKQIIDAVRSGQSDDVIADLRLQAKQLETELKRDDAKQALIGLLGSYSNVTEDTINQFKSQFEAKGIDIEQYIKRDAKGGIQLVDFKGLQQAMQQAGVAYSDVFNEYTAQISSDFMSQITTASDLLLKGTTSATAMDSFVKSYNTTFGTNKEIQDLFNYDAILKTWTLDPTVLKAYVQKQADALVEQGTLAEQDVARYIEDQTSELLKANVKISDYLSAQHRGEGSKARAQLEKSMRDYYIASNQWESEDYKDYLDQARKEIESKSIEDITPEELAREYAQDAEKANAQRRAAMNAQIRADIAAINAGGQAAIEVMKKYSETGELTSEEVEKAYKARFKNLSTAMDSLEKLGVNDVVDWTTRNLLNSIAGFSVNADGVVKAVGDLSAAYKEIYTQMKRTAVATQIELNTAYAKVLTAAEEKDADAVSALSNAMGMTYDVLGELLGKYNEDLELVMNNPSAYGIQQIGAGKVRIKDFNIFANKMGWEAGSEAYTSAFKTYNDSLIEYNKHIGTEIKEEFDNLLKSTPGEQVNLTRLTSTYGEDTIAQVLKDFDTVLKDGILTLGKAADIPGIAKAIGQYVVDSGGMLQTELEATLDQAAKQNQMDLVSAYTSIVQNYNAISMDTIAKFAKGMGKNYSTIISALRLDDSDADGVYKMDLAALKSVVDMGIEYVGQETYNQLLEVISGVQNNILSSISTTVGYTKTGTTNMSDMQKFVNELNTLTDQNIGISDAFEYDTILNTFKLSSATLTTYIDAQKAELEKLGMSGAAVDEYIYDQTINMLQANINVEDFLKATSTQAKSEAASKLGQSIKDWYEAQGAEVTDSTVEWIIRTIDGGGKDAVHWLKQIKGENVSTAELETAYNASISRLRTAAEGLTKKVGETVSGEAIAIMQAADYKLDSLEDGTAVITAVGDMVAAYAALYAAMENNAQHTTDDLNKTFAQMLTAADKSRTTALDALENASGMTYDAFADLLTQYGIKFKDVMADNKIWGVQSDGFGKVRIENWNDFVAKMNENGAKWDINNPEYAKAYSEWVDSRAEMANMPSKMMQSAADQLKSLTEATPGQAVNVSYLSTLMGGRLETIVESYGLELDQGLLQLTDTTDLPALITAIANEAADAGALIPEELAKVADAVAEMLSSITSLLTGGIEGKLKNEDALKLQQWADKHDMNMQLQFTQTKDGLQLATNQATLLVNRMRELDALQGEIAFQSLKDNLIKTDDRFKSVQETAGYIKSIEEEIARLNREEANPDNSRRIEALEQELALAKEIQMVRGTSEDNSFKFMEQNIPASQNNPLNYWNNWVKAYNAISESISGGNGRTGYMAYNDFYNLVTELGNLSELTGEAIPIGEKVKVNCENVADLINQAAGALEVTSDGSLKINLENIGVDFSSSAEGMAEGVDKGIAEVARSQISMLDGLISLLETIVAMEKLGDIDVQGNGIDLTDIFTIKMGDNGQTEITGFTEAYKKWRESILDQITEGNENFNKDLAEAMQKITINGSSLADMIKWDWSDFNPDTAQTFSSTLAALYKAAISNNYDLDNIAESVKEVLIESGLNNITVDIGDTSLVIAGGQVTSINWKSDDSKSVMEQIRDSIAKYKEANETEIHEYITILMQKYQNGEVLIKEELEWVVEMNHHIKIVDGVKTVTWEENTYTENDGNAYLAALAAWRLKETEGVQLDRDLTQAELDAGTVTTTATIGNKTNIKVTSNGTEISWHSDVTGEDYPSQDAMLKGEYQNWRERNARGNSNAQQDYETYEEWLYGEYNIRVKLQTNITGADGKPIDLSTDLETRQKIKQLMDDQTGKLKELLDAGADGTGNYVITLDNGVQIQLNGDDITVDGTYDLELVKQQIAAALGLDQGLADTITLGITNAFGENGIPIDKLKIIPTSIGVDGETVTVDPIEEASGTVAKLTMTATSIEVDSIGQQIVDKINEYLKSHPVTPTLNLGDNPTSSGDTGDTTTPEVPEITNPFTEIVETLAKISAAPFSAIVEQLDATSAKNVENVKKAADSVSDTNTKNLATASKEIKSGPAETAKTAINSINPTPAILAQAAINSIKASIETVTASGNLTVRVNVSSSSAKGNIGAFAKGNMALAGGTKTLMGELGPELVVSRGQYFLAGVNGAEFVDLDKDAIVFNHKQTQRLMAQGNIGSRGIPFTNETNAISYAKGNVEGPAKAEGSDSVDISILDYFWGNGSREQTFEMAKFTVGPAQAKGLGPALASASAALAALKQLRSMWQSLLSASVTDLAGAGGGGGGGGGPEGTDYGNFMKELEKWYNWLQKIAVLEEEINYQEQLRTKIQSDMIPHGADITKSYLTSLQALQQEVQVQRSLMNAQQEYFNSRREWMNSEKNPFSALYTFDENGQIKYKDGALEKFAKMVGSSEQGEPNMTAEEQYKKLVAMGYGDYLKYDTSGNEIDFSTDENGNLKDANAYESAVQAFWAKIDADKEEMQSLHDSINEHRDAVLEKQQKMNEIMKAIEDNQISVENRVLKAVESIRQREIDDAKDLRDAIKTASTTLINGLTQQLKDERSMYTNQKNKDELSKLQRQLAILQRSGGSASQISSLQSQISDKMQTAYFDSQQDQIDKLQEAANTQNEKLDKQITLMEEQLKYEKAHGLLWTQVYEVMSGSPEQIAQFIKENDASLWGESPTKSTQSYREMLYEAQQFVEFRDTVAGGLEALIDQMTDTTGDTEGAEGTLPETPETPTSDTPTEGSGDNKNYKATLYAQDSAGNKTKLGKFDVEAESEEKAIKKIKKQANKKIKELNKELSSDKQLLDVTEDYVKSKIKAYKKGGLITETGYIKVHGSEEEPEGILSSTDTRSMQQFWEKLNHDYDILEEIYEVFKELKRRALGEEEEQQTEEVPETIIEKLYRLTKIPLEELEQMTDQQIERLKRELGIEDTEESQEETEQAKQEEEWQKPIQTTMQSLQEYMRQQKERTRSLQQRQAQYDIDKVTSTASTYSNIQSGRDTIIIEQAAVNMNVEKINNDYDASRAGEKALEQMIKIARKTSGWNRIGR